jgi:hypothetical protein
MPKTRHRTMVVSLTTGLGALAEGESLLAQMRQFIQRRKAQEREFRAWVDAQNLNDVNELAGLSDAELIATTHAIPSQNHQMELMRRLKVAITELTRETIAARAAGTSQVSKGPAETGAAPANWKQVYPWPVVAFCSPSSDQAARPAARRGQSKAIPRYQQHSRPLPVDPMGHAWARPSTHQWSAGFITEDGGPSKSRRKRFGEPPASKALWRARTRADHLAWASILGGRAYSPPLPAHDPVVRLGGAGRPQRHL